MKRSILLVVLLFAGCASNAPPTLTPAGVLIWQANEAVVALGALQHAAIELNKVQRCEPACVPLLSDRNTGIVVDAVTSALLTIKQVPSGWKPTALAALTQIDARLDQIGKDKVAAYVRAARTVLEGI